MLPPQSSPACDRRELLARGVAWGGTLAQPAWGPIAAGLAPGPRTEDALDEALERLHARQLDVDIHRSNHQRFLQNPERQIALTHAITAPSAVRLLPPYVDEEAARAATRTNEERIDAALASGEAHALKLTEACLREDAVAPDPVFAAVAEAITGA